MVMTVFQRWPYAGRSASELGMPKTPMNCQATTVMEVLALWILAHGSAQRWLITCTEGLARGPQGLSPSHTRLRTQALCRLCACHRLPDLALFSQTRVPRVWSNLLVTLVLSRNRQTSPARTAQELQTLAVPANPVQPVFTRQPPCEGLSPRGPRAKPSVHVISHSCAEPRATGVGAATVP
jgi:hypothetical protein